MRTPSGRMIIQPDWSDVLREHNGKIWVSFKKEGEATVHGEIRASVGSDLPTGTGGFSVVQFQPPKISVKYTDNVNTCQTTFQAPNVTFTAIHPTKTSISSMDVSTGGLAVSSDTKRNLVIWETETGEVRRRLVGHVADVYACRFFPSGVVVLSGGADMMAKIWSAETGQCAATLMGHRAAINDFAIVDRGRNVVSCSKDGTAKVWDCGVQKCLLSFDHCRLGEVNACALVPAADAACLGDVAPDRSEREVGTDGKIIALAGENGKLEVYSMQSRKLIFDVDCELAVNCCCFLDGTQLVAGTQDGHVQFWDVRHTGNRLKSLSEGRSEVLSMCSSPAGLLVSTGDGSCYSIKNNYILGQEFTGTDCDPVYSVVHDGHSIYTSCRDGFVRKYVNVLNP